MNTSKSWSGLSLFLIVQSGRIPLLIDVWQAYKPKRLAPTLAQEWLRAAEAPYRAEIEKAIDVWIRTREWPEVLSESAQGHLRLRLTTVAGFLAALCLCGEHSESSWVPFERELAPIETARWFLTDWWEKHGIDEASRVWVLDQLEFREYVPKRS